MNRIKNIEHKIDELIDIFGYESFPIPIIDICHKLDIKVYQTKMEDDKHGFILIDKRFQKSFNTDKIIIINENDTVKDKRFATAYALACYYLECSRKHKYHHLLQIKYDRFNEDEQIGRFAACLLAPKNLLVKKYNSYLENTSLNFYEIVHQLSRLFVVSANIIEKRLIEDLKVNSNEVV